MFVRHGIPLGFALNTCTGVYGTNLWGQLPSIVLHHASVIVQTFVFDTASNVLLNLF